MKYYYYVSASKVEMLFPQVARNVRESVSAEIGFNVGLVSGSIGSEATRLDDTITRLIAVERHLKAAQLVGDVKQPRGWFYGAMKAKTVGLWSQGGAVFFLGATANTLVTLGGSMKNLLGGEIRRGEGPPYSHLAPLLKELERLVMSESATMATLSESATMANMLEPFNFEPQSYDLEEPQTWPELAQYIAHSSNAPEERIHFLARLLAVHTNKYGRVILGTPLYVASGWN